MTSLAQPIGRKKAQNKQMEKLQQQLQALEKQNAEKTMLLERLDQLSRMDTERTQLALDRASSTNRTLRDEIDRKYGENNSPRIINNKLVEDIIAKRTKDFQRSQAEKAYNMQLLNQERLKILEARDRLKAKQELYHSLPSPLENKVTVIEMVPRGRSSGHPSVHSPNSYVRKVANDLPNTLDKIWNLRDNLHDEYIKKRRPYAGELGISSYLPRQIPNYFLVRGIVEDFVDNFIATHIPEDHLVQKQNIKLQKLNHRVKDWEKHSKALTEREAVQLVAEELLLEVTSSMAQDLASEDFYQDQMFKKMSSNLFIREAESQAVGNPNGREPDDPTYDLITNTFYNMQRHRDQFKKRIWSHSQVIRHPSLPPYQVIHIVEPPPPKSKKKSKVTKPPTQPPVMAVPRIPAVVDQPLDADVQVISYDYLHPVDLKLFETNPADSVSVQQQKFWHGVYVRREAAYWHNLRPEVFTIPLAKHCLGVTAIRPSPDHMQLAVGMKSGDVVVYNTQVFPWTAVKLDIGQETNSYVTHLAWSLDSSRLLAVKSTGTVSVWLTIGHPASRERLRLMDFPANDLKHLPYSLKHLHTFKAADGDLTIHQGSLVEKGTSRTQDKACLAAFFPSLTLFTTQHSVCIALQNNDILKLDLESTITDINLQRSPMLLKPKIKTKTQEPNLIRQNIEAELLREHKHPIIHLDCVGNIGKIITVDRSGLICLWKYERSQLSEFNWFLPVKKYKLKMSKTSYIPSPEGITKIVFSDQQGKLANQLQIAKDRKIAQLALSRLNLGDPWHISHQANNLIKYIYEPPGKAQNTTSVFHIVTRHKKTQQLSSHKTQMWTPVQVQCTRLLFVKQTPTGNDLVLLLLFPAQSPKSPHITIIILNLQTMKLRDMRKDLDITDEEHNELNEVKILSCAVTQTYGPTGSEYLFLTLNGRLSCVSLSTGEITLCFDSITKPQVPQFRGLKINKKILKLSKYFEVATIGNFGALHAILHERDTEEMIVLKLDNGNLPQETRLMTKAYHCWGGKLCPSELRVNPVDCLLPDMKHKEAEMRTLILSLIPRDEDSSPADRMNEKIGNYLSLAAKVKKQALLDDL